MIKISENLKQFGYGFVLYKSITAIRGFGINPLLYLISPDKTVGMFMTFLCTFITSFLMILIYDYLKKDLILIELLKKSQEEKTIQINHNSVTRKIVKHSKFGQRFLVLILMIWDPTITLIYCRPGHYRWNRIPNMSMFVLFFLSSLSCNVIGWMILGHLQFF